MDVPVAIDEWHSSVSIDTPNGQQVYGTGTRRHDTPHGPTAAGRAVLRYTIPSLPLAGGQYFINSELLRDDGMPFDIRWQGAMFFVPSVPMQSGTVFASTEISEG